jgi:hypothetical protein
MADLRALTEKEIESLEQRGCTAEDWRKVGVARGFDTNRLLDVSFFGTVEIGRNTGWTTLDGLRRPCGLYHAVIADCSVGNDVFISRIGSSIQGYVIEDDVVIEDISCLVCEAGVFFGNGYSVPVMNETGGRSVALFNELTAQIAHLVVFYRHDSALQSKLDTLISEQVQSRRHSRGRVSRGARIRDCGRIKNTCIGPWARVLGASRVEDGTILSCAEHPTKVGAGVIMEHFVLSEGASVDSGAVLKGVFVGQGSLVGKQCSVENSLLFANCEAFHTEICSVFAGPYTVTHHKSTLLIAGLWSFFNAGSGTNQSNHMYKLGPVHQGVFERGCKSGSFAYTMEECHIPAFSVVIGKHMSNLDIPDFPFSFINEEEEKSNLIMGMNVFSTGTVRDAEKWRERDRRKAPHRRDLIVFDVFSPYTVEKMRRGRDILAELQERTPREEQTVRLGGVWIKRLFIKKGLRYYNLAIDRYLLGAFVDRVEEQAASRETWKQISETCLPAEAGEEWRRWSDVGGLLISNWRERHILESIKDGRVHSIEELLKMLEEAHGAYEGDVWNYVCHAFEEEYGTPPHEVQPGQFIELARRWAAAAGSLLSLTLENTRSEFSERSRIGYGLDGDEDARGADFEAVRGTYDDNQVVRSLIARKHEVEERLARLEDLGEKFA